MLPEVPHNQSRAVTVSMSLLSPYPSRNTTLEAIRACSSLFVRLLLQPSQRHFKTVELRSTTHSTFPKWLMGGGAESLRSRDRQSPAHHSCLQGRGWGWGWGAGRAWTCTLSIGPLRADGEYYLLCRAARQWKLHRLIFLFPQTCQKGSQYQSSKHLNNRRALATALSLCSISYAQILDQT